MSPPAADPVSRLGLPQIAGFYALAFFVFSIFSGSIDFIATRYAPFLMAVRPSLLAALWGLSIVGLSGRVGVLIRHKVTIMYMALTIWFIVCVPFAVWQGGAVSTIVSNWSVTALSLVLAGGLIWNSDQCRKIVHLIGYSAIILSLIALAAGGRDIEGRLILAKTRFANTNELATDLAMALPCLAFMALRRGNGIRRFLALAGSAPILLAIAETGSRAALIGSAAAGMAVFLSVSIGQKLKLLVAGAAIFAALMVVVPARISRRFFTVFGDTSHLTQVDDITQSAILSAQARRMLLMDSITVTLQHPIVGVGLGNFEVAQDSLARARGEAMGNWHVTHNTFTQLSSESGLPGLALFLMAIFYSLRSLSRTMRMPAPPGSLAWRDIHTMAFTFRISLIALLTCALFDSMAYVPIIALMLGLTISLEYCANSLLLASPPVAPAWGQRTARTSPGRPSLQALPAREHPVRQLPSRIWN